MANNWIEVAVDKEGFVLIGKMHIGYIVEGTHEGNASFLFYGFEDHYSASLSESTKDKLIGTIEELLNSNEQDGTDN